MKKLSANKRAAMERLSTKEGIISALAIDQRGALRKMMTALGKEADQKSCEEFKVLVSRDLTPYASSILLDPEYGLPAAKVRDDKAGLLLAYEKTGYDATVPGRLPDILEDWSVLRLAKEGADAIKFLLYYDVDEDAHINHLKQVFVERLGSECQAEDLPFYLELVSYDAKGLDTSSPEYAALKPHKVIDMMKEFSKPQYKVDVLKVEVPVNMAYVEGFAKSDVVYSRQEAKDLFYQQSQATDLPFIFLSAGVSAQLFQDTLRLAKEAGSSFNGVLCGRATWKNAVQPFAQGTVEDTEQWLETEGRANIESLNAVLKETASSWFDKVE